MAARGAEEVIPRFPGIGFRQEKIDAFLDVIKDSATPCVHS